LERARTLGAQVEMEMTLFLRFCRAPIIGVTGTKGKTTTSSILGNLLRQRWPQAVLAGNMGHTALGQLSAVNADEPVALEISSFQLEALDEQRLAPHIAVLTNVSEDHLDRYASFDDYAQVKAAIARHQSAEDWVIYPRDDARISALLEGVSARRMTFGVAPVDDDNAVWMDGQRFAGRWGGEPVDLGPLEALAIPGAHNRLNALAAAAAALAAGVSPDEVAAGIASAQPVANRLESIGTVNGVEYVNDTTATTPAAAIAALQSFANRAVIVVAGGSNKNVSLEPLADAIAAHAQRALLLDGAATPELMKLLQAHGQPDVEGPFPSMQAVVERASQVATPGSVVLLSPGCASFGMFRNEFQRGDLFREAVARLDAEAKS
jgi:UDP-N-acetylmuramoylalanine--D-glutamate ligase